MYSLYETAIAGLHYLELKEIPSDKGSVLHMLRKSSPLFSHFGEMYFSEVYEGAIKGWKLHRLQSQLFAVPIGKIEFVFFDARTDSTTYGKLHNMCLGRPEHYFLLSVPLGLWYGFKGLAPGVSLLANCADREHDPNESLTQPLDSSIIPYDWG